MKHLRIYFSIFLRIIGRLILKSRHLSYNVTGVMLLRSDGAKAKFTEKPLQRADVGGEEKISKCLHFQFGENHEIKKVTVVHRPALTPQQLQ